MFCIISFRNILPSLVGMLGELMVCRICESIREFDCFIKLQQITKTITLFVLVGKVCSSMHITTTVFDLLPPQRSTSLLQ